MPESGDMKLNGFDARIGIVVILILIYMWSLSIAK